MSSKLLAVSSLSATGHDGLILSVEAVFLKVLGDSLRELFVKCADILLKPSQTGCVYTLAEYLTW